MNKYQQIIHDLKEKELFNPDIFEIIEKQTLLDNPTLENRIKLEIKEIKKAGLIDYYIELIQSDKKYHNSINSVCAHIWEITPENPETKDLNWEISQEYPDLDIDFSPEKRNAIKEYCSQEFGSEHVVSICNYNHFGIKSGIRDIARVLEVPLEEVSFTTRLDDDVNKMTWEKSVETYPELATFEEKYPQVCQLVRDFNGRVRSIGKHAGGLVISNVDLSRTIPLITREDPETGERFVLSSFAEGQDRSDLKPFGLIKQDILGLDNLNYISSCLEIMESRGLYDPKKGLFKISPEHEEWSDETYLTDPKSLELANKADLKGVFQFDSPGMRDLAKKGGISCFEDLVALTALFRPGPLNSGMAESFIQRKQGKEVYDKNPILDNVVGNTYGIIVYQEQLMQIMNKVGLISLQDCDNIRRAMGKKKLKDFMKYKDQFCINGQKTLGKDWIGYYHDYKSKYLESLSHTDNEFYQKYIKKESLPDNLKEEAEVSFNEKFADYKKSHKELKFVEDLWDQMVTFADYGFNFSHALAYTMVSARCLYLKTHYPKEYFSAVLSHLKTGDARIKIYIQDSRIRGIDFLPLDINKSKFGFSIDPETDKIIIGFDKVKGISKEAELLVNKQPYTSITDFTERYGSNKRTTEALVKCGAFERFEKNMTILLKYFEYHRENKNEEFGMGKLDFSRMYKELTGQKSCPKDISSQLNQFLENRKKVPFEELIELNNSNKFSFICSEKEKIACYLELNRNVFQKKILSFEEFKAQDWIRETKDFYDEEKYNFEEDLYGFVFHHPLDGYERQDMLIGDVLKSKGIGIIEGVITDIVSKNTKNGQSYYIITVEDEYDSLKILLWSNQYTENRECIIIGSAIRTCVIPSQFATWNLAKSGRIEKMKPIDTPERREQRENKSLENFNKFIQEEFKIGEENGE